MIRLCEAQAGELEAFLQMDRDADTRAHIIPYDLEQHRGSFDRDDIIYLSIRAHDRCVGYFILVLEEDARSVEFRRIVIAEKGAGYGQAAIAEMEAYCGARLGRERIWLDVYDTNSRGRHIYEKLGYRQFSSAEADGRKLLLMEKSLLES